MRWATLDFTSSEPDGSNIGCADLLSFKLKLSNISANRAMFSCCMKVGLPKLLPSAPDCSILLE